MASSAFRTTRFVVLCLIINYTGHITLSEAVICPDRCNCDWILDSLSVNCSSLNLAVVPDFSDLPIESLDLSNNKFSQFPTELSLLGSLTTLDLSYNFITNLAADSLLGFKSLRQLYLRANNITTWADINPSKLLLNAERLQTFSLAGNSISTFSSNNQRSALISPSLITLDLSFCMIAKIEGAYALQGMPRLENLILSGNPLHTFTRLDSTSLNTISLSNCQFQHLDPGALNGLPNLYVLDLSRNSMLILEPQGGELIHSRSLRRINLSYCNMPAVYLQGFPNVTTVLLKGNMLREVTDTMFRLNSQIEFLDLSRNAIRMIEFNAFNPLRSLKSLDLSYNMIAEVNRNLFSNNELLTNLKLSRNYLAKFSGIIGTSLVNLDLSSCEITSITADALIHMPITDLDLSNNLISSLPPGFGSKTLQTLDLSLNRLSSISNTTFRQFPELSALALSGNRFTTPFRADFFKKNPYLHLIALEDNPWRCECKDPSFKHFFLYLTQTPPKITNTKTLKCTTPESSFGLTWDAVCFPIWFPRSNASAVEKFWSITMSCLAALALGFLAYKLFKKFTKKRKQRRNRAELQENVEEQRRVQELNRQFIQHQASQNAPDPRESNPPSYEVALLMPPLKRLTKSYADITMKDSNDDLDQPVAVRERSNRNRYHSDNALLGGDGDDDRTAKIRRTPSFRRQARSRRGSRLVAVRPPRCPDGKMSNSQSLGKISGIVYYENSPYSRRKPRSTTTGSGSLGSSREDVRDEGPSSSLPLRNNSLDFIENYYVRPKSISNSGDDYEIVSSHSDGGSRRTSVRSSIASVDVGIVIVHNKPPSEGQAPASEPVRKSSNDSREPRESQF